ncbi:MAG: P1 family peptidase [Planctomycetota bacterium]|jgi:D-aminopeptidase
MTGNSMQLIGLLCLVSCALAPPQDPQPAQSQSKPQERPRVREAGIRIGALPPGKHNAITDVAGVLVGHATVHKGDSVRTGVTVILPHNDNLFRNKVPAAIHVGNGFGKLVGTTQVQELGNIESPIALTNTLNVGKVMDALVAHMLAMPGNENVRSINVVVGETNDGGLNDIRGRHVEARHVEQAIAAARTGPVSEGSVGAGYGTICFGWKGGIGTASRRTGDYTVGVLVQSNFGGTLTVAGTPVQHQLRRTKGDDGSCMIVVATDAPLSARNLGRLAKRSLAGMARTGASFSSGSGDYVIAFSTAKELRIRPGGDKTGAPVLKNERMSSLFRAVAEATEEAILNSLFRATTVSSSKRTVKAIPLDKLLPLLRKK